MTEEQIGSEEIAEEISTEANEEGLESSTGEIEEESSEENESEGQEEATEELSEEERAEAERQAEYSKIYKTIVDGQEQEVTLESLIKERQLKEASYKKFQIAAEKEKKAEALVEALKENPVAALRNAGMTEEAIKEYIYKEAARLLDEDELPEEERRLKALEEENRRYKEAEEKRQKEREEQAYQDTVNKEIESFEKQFISALQKSDIPSTPEAIRSMAAIMSEALEYNVDMTVEDAAEYYKEQEQARVSKMLGELPGDALVKLLGKEAADKIRKNDIAKIKNPAPKKDLPLDNTAPRADAKKESMSEYFERLKREAAE